MSTVWREDGQKDYEKNYRYNTKDGLWTEWHKDGKDGDGLWIKWYMNGQKLEKGNYKDENKNGLWTYWYENGQREMEGFYKDGWKDGLWTYYTEDGSVKKVKEY